MNADILKENVLSTVQEKLGADYRRVKNVFYKFYGDFFHIVEVQFVKIGPDEYAFTIYFGVVVPKIFLLLWEEKYKEDDYRKLTARNGVFNCNVNDIIENFKGKAKISYWNLSEFEIVADDIADILKEKFIPYITKFDSLAQLNSIIDTTRYPLKKSSDTPLMILALKLILGKTQDFYDLASELKLTNNDFYGKQIDKLISRASYN